MWNDHNYFLIDYNCSNSPLTSRYLSIATYHSDEGLTLETSAFHSLGWPIYVINSVDNTKLPCYTLPCTDALPQFLLKIALFIHSQVSCSWGKLNTWTQQLKSAKGIKKQRNSLITSGYLTEKSVWRLSGHKISSKIDPIRFLADSDD